jgi:hypothetical protein
MSVGRRVTDADALGNFAQAQTLDPLLRQDFNPGLDEGVLEIAVMIFFGWHTSILSHNLDSVKIVV